MDITLEESTTEKVTSLLHQIVHRILSENQTPDSVQKDLLFVLIVVLMVENGFLPINNKSEVIDLQDSFNIAQLANWKLPSGICETTFILSGFRNVTVKLLMSPLGAMVLVNLVINELDYETYSTCLPVSRYVVSPQATSVPMIYRDLKHFAITLKNKIISAVKSRIISYNGYASASLIGLPDDVLYKIMLYLKIADIINVCKTCSRLKILLEDPSLWYALNKRDYGDISNVDTKNWKERYIKNYILQQENQQRTRHQRAGSMHDYMDYADFVSYVDNPMWNVI